MKTLTDVIQKYTQVLKYSQRRRALPWLNKDIFQLMKKRDLALKHSLLTKTNTDIFVFKGLRNKVVRELRKAKTNYFLLIYRIALLFGVRPIKQQLHPLGHCINRH